MSVFRLPRWTDEKWAAFRSDLETGASRTAVCAAHGLSESVFYKYVAEGREVQSRLESGEHLPVSLRESLVLRFVRTVDEAASQAELSLVRPLIDAATGQGNRVEVVYKFDAAAVFSASNQLGLIRPKITDTEAMLSWLETLATARPDLDIQLRVRSRPLFDIRANVFLLKTRHGYRDTGLDPENVDDGYVPDVYL